MIDLISQQPTFCKTPTFRSITSLRRTNKSDPRSAHSNEVSLIQSGSSLCADNHLNLHLIWRSSLYVDSHSDSGNTQFISIITVLVDNVKHVYM